MKNWGARFLILHSKFEIRNSFNIPSMIRKTLSCLLLFVCVNAFAIDAAQLQLALKKLTVLGSAMYVAAHPGDDNAALIAFFADDRLYRTAYLSMTRGDGGQNLI